MLYTFFIIIWDVDKIANRKMSNKNLFFGKDIPLKVEIVDKNTNKI